MILDTNALSAFVDGDAGVGDALRTQARAAIPVIVLGEFRYGVGQSRRRSSYEAWLDANLIHFDILSVTEETAIAYAALRMRLKRSGRPIPANDAWIAALALQHRLPVLSRDEHFDVVPGLDRRSWVTGSVATKRHVGTCLGGAPRGNDRGQQTGRGKDGASPR